MSPVDSQGNYQMNPQVSSAMDQGAPQSSEPESQIILTKMSDGTITCDDGSGQPSVHDNVDDALNYAKQSLGGDQSDMAAGSEQPDTSQSSEEMNG